MVVKNHNQLIVDRLQGRTDELLPIPRERLDWPGSGAMLELYRNTSGRDRSELIRAFGQVMHHPGPPALTAELVAIASNLDLAEVEPQVRKLQADPFACQVPLQGAVRHYLARRNLNLSPSPGAIPTMVNSQAAIGKETAAPELRPERLREDHRGP